MFKAKMNNVEQTNIVLQNTVLTKLMAQVARGLAELETTALTEQQSGIVEYMLKSTNDSRTLLGNAVVDPPSYKSFIEKGTTRFRSIEELKAFLKAVEPSKENIVPTSLVRFKKRKNQEEETFSVVLDGVHMIQNESLHQSSLNTQMLLLLIFTANSEGVALQCAFPITERPIQNLETKTKTLGEMPFFAALHGTCEMKLTLQQQSVKLSPKLLVHNPADVLEVLQSGAMNKLSNAKEQASRQLLLSLSLRIQTKYRTADALCHDLTEHNQ